METLKPRLRGTGRVGKAQSTWARWLQFAAIGLVVTVTQMQGNPAHAQAASPYLLPYDVDALLKRPAAAGGTLRACPALIPPPVALQHEPRYAAGDGSASVVDPKRAAAEIEATRPVRLFNRLIADNADLALLRPAEARTHWLCVVTHLDHWATGGAFSGRNSMQGEFEKKWGAINYSLAFMEARPAATPQQAQPITNWLKRMGHDVMDQYDGLVVPIGINSKANNHAYWAALSTTTVGMATGDASLFDWGMKRYLSALDDIDVDGYLPLELKRGSRALDYHRFALEPLLLLSVIARANGVNISTSKLAALRRLVQTVQAGLSDDSQFVRRSGQQQTSDGERKPFEWAWGELAARMFPDMKIDQRIAGQRPYFHIWLGGDLTIRYSRQN